MDEIQIHLTIGRTVLVFIGLLIMLLAGAGVVMGILMRRRMKKMTLGGGCPCIAALRGEGHTRD